MGAGLARDSIGPTLCYDRTVTATRFRGGRIMGIRIPTVFAENDAKRCAGCGEPIESTPFRVSIMDNVAPESAPSWAERAPLNPGPHQFHADPDALPRLGRAPRSLPVPAVRGARAHAAGAAARRASRLGPV